jgi:hypothetical protein
LGVAPTPATTGVGRQRGVVVEGGRDGVAGTAQGTQACVGAQGDSLFAMQVGQQAADQRPGRADGRDGGGVDDRDLAAVAVGDGGEFQTDQARPHHQDGPGLDERVVDRLRLRGGTKRERQLPAGNTAERSGIGAGGQHDRVGVVASRRPRVRPGAGPQRHRHLRRRAWGMIRGARTDLAVDPLA